jgi:Yip1-like protein
VTETITSPQTALPAPSKGLAARIVGVITSPRDTYTVVAAQPRWLGVMAVVLLVGCTATFLFLSTDVGKQAMFDQQIRVMESFGVKINDTAYARMEAGLGRAPYAGALGQAVTLPVVALVVSGLALAIFNAILGGDATFRQVFAVVAHSGVIVSLAQIFGLPLAYMRETMSSTTSLAVFLPFLDENSFAARFLGSIDLFQIWWLISLAIGFGVLYRKKTGPIATTMIAVYASLALIVAAIRSVLSGA